MRQPERRRYEADGELLTVRLRRAIVDEIVNFVRRMLGARERPRPYTRRARHAATEARRQKIRPRDQKRRR